MPKKIKIHFVCRGNIFRSRLAEAYLKSIKGDEWEITSSGTVENKYPNRVLASLAWLIAKEQGFEGFFSPKGVQTDPKILARQDLIIFMKQNVFDEAVALGSFNTAKSVIWDVRNIQTWGVYQLIKRNVDELVKEIERGGWVDIVDENNTPIKFRLPIKIANQNRQWFRCCHAIITTPSLKTLVQKRSSNIIFAPSLLDISLGGHVDSGEVPEAAMRREIFEESGLKVGKMKPLEIAKQSGYHPHYKTHTRTFVYTYHVPIDEENPQLVSEKSEVAKMVLLPSKPLHRLLKRHSIKGLGRLNYSYKFYARNIKKIGI